MTDGTGIEGDADLLRSKRDATRYRILVEIAERQPAVNQQEIADAIGITAQAVSDYLQELVEEGYVEKEGRGRYEVTKEGVDWLISRTESLESFVRHVAEDVIGQVEVETAIAAGNLREGDTVSLSMRDGVLTATPGDAGATTAVAVTDAERGQDVGVTDFEGVIDYDLGTVTVLGVPRVTEGGSQEVDGTTISELAADHDLVAVTGTEALAAVRRADLEAHLRFGAPAAVAEAAVKGVDVLLVAVQHRLSAATEQLREENLSYEVVEPGE